MHNAAFHLARMTTTPQRSSRTGRFRLAIASAARGPLLPAFGRGFIHGILALAIACGGDGTGPTPPPHIPVPTSVVVTPVSVAMTAIDDTTRFSAQVRDQDGQPMTGASVSWLSDDILVAVVGPGGLAKATGNGTATVTARAGDASGTATVTVEQRVVTVKVSPDSSVLVVGETLSLEVSPVDANDHAVGGAQVAWESSDTAVATVGESGLVTAAGVGRTRIVVSSDGVAGEAVVAVLPTPAAIAIAPKAIDFASLGDTMSISATALDAQGREIDGLAVTWSSADSTIATVDTLGRVVSVGNGEADISAARASASAVATARVAQVAASLEVLPAADTVPVGDSLALTAAAADANGYAIAAPAAPIFSWTSSAPEVVAVDVGGLAAALAPGSASVTALTGDLEAAASLTVEAAAIFDKRILSAFYEATDGPEWTRSDGWMTDAPLQEWYGVGVGDDGRVESLALSENGVDGPIPPQLGDLRSLRFLDLGRNAVNGGLPDELADLDRLETLLLHSNDLVGGIPKWLADMPSLRSLVLFSNDFDGPIPKELGRMPVITRLDLGWNYLTGEIPPELGDLSTLVYLDLGRNDLEGDIPPRLGNLADLVQLNLRSNELTGPVPPELGRLAELQWLELSFNALSGEIPPELGDLRSLVALGLTANRIAGEIPPQLGRPTRLTRLYLGRNQLTGDIPPELGGLGSLESLDVLSNHLDGPLPPELGRLAALRELLLARNHRLRGVLPPELTSLALDELQLGGTGLCAPADDGFRAWLASIGTGWAPLCAEERTHAYLVQASQSAAVPVKLVAGDEALLRVFVVADSGASASFPTVRARFFADGREVHSVTVPGSSRPIPTAIDEGAFDASANARIPGSVLVPGLEMAIEIDPEGLLPSGIGVPQRWPETGRAALDVREMSALDLTLVPFLYSQNPDEALAARVKELTAANPLFRSTRDLLPVEEFSVTAREPVWTSVDPVFDNSSALLRETWALRTMDGATAYYMGVMRGGGGRGYVGWPASVSGLSGGTISHELGHNMSLRHAPCGDPSNIELSYPYLDGSIGSWGYDFLFAVPVSPTRPDLMSYCGPEWVSDYNFNKALRFRETLEPQRTGQAAAAAGAPPVAGPALLLWGGTDADGVPVLEPAFVVHAPSSLPLEEGPFRLAGLTADEDTLFSFSFAMPETADGDGESAFAFALPAQDSWADALDEIVLIGPGGSDSVGRESGSRRPESPGRASVLLVDGASGRVRGFLRDEPGRAQTVSGAILRLPEPGLEAVVSRGVPDATAWRR